MIEEQKAEAIEILRQLRRANCNPVILGGAPRDWFFGKPAKDLDVYIQFPKKFSDAELLQHLKEYTTPSVIDITSENPYVLELDDGVMSVFGIPNGVLPIQIIRCDRDPVDMLELFHCSLSKVSAHLSMGELAIVGTSEFYTGEKYKANFIKKGFNPKYIAKIQDKFPDFTSVYEQ